MSKLVTELEVADENLPGTYTWDEAMKACEALGDGWRLPTKEELHLMHLYKNPIGGFGEGWLWSSSRQDSEYFYAWAQCFSDGRRFCYDKLNQHSVRACRASNRFELVSGLRVGFKDGSYWSAASLPVNRLMRGHGDFIPATPQDEENDRINYERGHYRDNFKLRCELGLVSTQAALKSEELEVWKSQFRKLRAEYHAIGGKGWPDEGGDYEVPDALFRPLPDFDESLPPISPVPQAIPEPGKTEAVPPVPYPRRLVFTLAAVISSVAALVSAWNSYEWLSTVRPPFVAAPMAAIVVGAGILFPDFAIILWRRRKRVLSAFVLAAGIAGILISMFSTVAALYNGRQGRWEAGAEGRAAATELSAARAERERLKASYDETVRLIADTERKVGTFTAEQTLNGASQTLQNRLLSYRSDRDGISAKMAASDALVARLEAQAGAQRADVYSYLAEMTGGTAPSVEFLTMAVPAVFLDLVAPVMVGLMVFL